MLKQDVQHFVSSEWHLDIHISLHASIYVATCMFKNCKIFLEILNPQKYCHFSLYGNILQFVVMPVAKFNLPDHN